MKVILILGFILVNQINLKLSRKSEYDYTDYKAVVHNKDLKDQTVISSEVDESALYINDTNKVIEEMIANDKIREYDLICIRNKIKSFIINNTSSKTINDTLTGDLSRIVAELACTGSTARGTCVPGDADYDFMLRINNEELKKSDELIDKLVEYLKPKKNNSRSK